MSICIAIAAIVLILALAVMMIYCAFENIKRMQDYDAYLRQLAKDGKKLDMALKATTKIIEIQNKKLEMSEELNQIQEVLHEYESEQKSDS